MRAAVDQFKAWFATAPMLKYSGRVSNANKLARIQPVVAMFCRENEEVVRQLGCAPGRGYARTMAGQKGAASDLRSFPGLSSQDRQVAQCRCQRISQPS